MKKIILAIWNVIAVLFGFDCNIRREAVEAGVCDYSGQGKDVYGN